MNDWIKLIRNAGSTAAFKNDVGENWYARLNKLKVRHLELLEQKPTDVDKIIQSMGLIQVMISRMLVVHFIIKALEARTSRVLDLPSGSCEVNGAYALGSLNPLYFRLPIGEPVFQPHKGLS